MSSGKEVIILAGGLGTRLKSELGENTPKCLAPINGVPFLQYQLTWLSKQGVGKVVLALGHLSDEVIEWCENNKWKFDLRIEYSKEEQKLGTGGAIKLALKRCENTYVYVVNGDTYFPIDLIEIPYTELITIACKHMDKVDRYGTVRLWKHGEILNFLEKHKRKFGLINGGVYLINKDMFNTCTSQFKTGIDEFSFEHWMESYLVDWLADLTTKLPALYGKEFNRKFCDIGVPEDYKGFSEMVN